MTATTTPAARVALWCQAAGIAPTDLPAVTLAWLGDDAIGCRVAYRPGGGPATLDGTLEYLADGMWCRWAGVRTADALREVPEYEAYLHAEAVQEVADALARPWGWAA
jgi:hypothetical protein